MAKINLAIKNINALFVIINLHPILFQVVQKVQNHFRRSKENILLAPNAASLHFSITTMMITQIIVVPIRNAIIHFFKPNLP